MYVLPVRREDMKELRIGNGSEIEAVAVSALLEMNTSDDTSDMSIDEPRDDTVRETLHTTTDNHSR